jgi:hypothetical protein
MRMKREDLKAALRRAGGAGRFVRAGIVVIVRRAP